MSKKFLRSSLFISIMLVLSITLSGCSLDLGSIVSGLKNVLGSVVSGIGGIIQKGVGVVKKVVEVAKPIVSSVGGAIGELTGNKDNIVSKIDSGVSKVDGALDKVSDFGGKMKDTGDKLKGKVTVASTKKDSDSPIDKSDSGSSSSSSSSSSSTSTSTSTSSSSSTSCSGSTCSSSNKKSSTTTSDVKVNTELLTESEKKELASNMNSGLDKISSGLSDLTKYFDEHKNWPKKDWDNNYNQNSPKEKELRSKIKDYQSQLNEIKKDPTSEANITKYNELKKKIAELENEAGNLFVCPCRQRELNSAMDSVENYINNLDKQVSKYNKSTDNKDENKK